MVTIRVDVTQPIIDFDGVTVLNHQKVEAGQVIDVLDSDGNPKPFTVRNSIAKAINTLLASEKERGDHPPEIKDDVFRVMCLVAANDHADLTDDDRKLVLDRALENCPALIRGRIIEAFDNGEKVSALGKTNGKGKIDKTELASVE